MIDDLRDRFLPRFVESARARLARGRRLFVEGDPVALALELHALAGEAAMLGFDALAEDASRGEAAARSCAGSSPGDHAMRRSSCASSLDATGRALELLITSAAARSPT